VKRIPIPTTTRTHQGKAGNSFQRRGIPATLPNPPLVTEYFYERKPFLQKPKAALRKLRAVMVMRRGLAPSASTMLRFNCINETSVILGDASRQTHKNLLPFLISDKS